MSGLSREAVVALVDAVRAGPGVPLPPVLHRILHLPVTLRVELGRQRCTLHDVMDLAAGKLLELSRDLDDPLEVRVESCILGLGRVVVVGGGKFGVEIISVAPTLPEGPPPSRVRRAAAPAIRIMPEQLPEV